METEELEKLEKLKKLENLLERYIDPNYDYNQQVNSSHTEVPYIEERDEDVNKLVLSDNEIIDIQSGWKHTKQEDSSFPTIDENDKLSAFVWSFDSSQFKI